MKERPERAAVIVWIDIEDCTSSGWISQREAKRDAQRGFKDLHSVGFVIYEDEERICLASTWGPETCGVLRIPKGVCKSITYIDLQK